MTRAVLVLILFAFHTAYSQEMDVLDKPSVPPFTKGADWRSGDFFSKHSSSDEEKITVPAFSFESKEWGSVRVYLQSASTGEPLNYSSHLETEVCSDGLCKPVSITIMWDLLGLFLSYHTDDEYQLTKFDHVKLTEKDHVQLHKILSDTSSLLRDYRVEDMIDTTVKIKSKEVADAITGATSKVFEGISVEGALYTVYTLWHFTNGIVRDKIISHTHRHLSDSFIKYMLHSGRRHYVEFVFDNMTDKQKEKFIPDIVTMVKHKDTYIPHFSLAQLSDKMLINPAYSKTLLEYLPKASVPLQNELLERYGEIKLAADALSLLIRQLPQMSDGQVIRIFKIIENNKANLNPDVLKELTLLSDHPRTDISRQVLVLVKKLTLD